MPNAASGAQRRDRARRAAWKSSVPNRDEQQQHAEDERRSRRSRLTMNAFLPASAADFFWYQKPISRYEQRPTPSQPTNITEEVRAEHEHQHEGGEQVQVREVARVLRVRLLVHVGGRVDVDQRADAGDDEDHHRRQRIEAQRERHLEVAGRDPGEQRLRRSGARLRRSRSSAPRPRRRDTANDADHRARTATPPETAFDSRRPSDALTQEAERTGRSGISEQHASGSPLQRRERVGVERLAVAGTAR